MPVVVYALLPESIEYLVEKRPAGALSVYNRIGRRLGFAAAPALPQRQSHLAGTQPWRQIFQGVTLWWTACLWIGYAGLIAAFGADPRPRDPALRERRRRCPPERDRRRPRPAAPDRLPPASDARGGRLRRPLADR